jgi:enoyl-CoA hydratase/carnithine racemase
MSEALLLKIRDGAVGRLTLNDPGRANALSAAMLEALARALTELNADPAVRVIVVDAVGKVFCAGHDLAALRATDKATDHQALFETCSRLMMAIGAGPKPVIAKVRGAAVAAGCQLVASCDLAYAAQDARFAVSGINLGLFCSTPAVALSRTVGRKDALEMLLTGRFASAAEAAQMGLINRAVPSSDLEETVETVARTLADKPPEALALGKRLFSRQANLPLAEAYDLAGRAMAENLSFPSTKAGIDAFLTR